MTGVTGCRRPTRSAGRAATAITSARRCSRAARAKRDRWPGSAPPRLSRSWSRACAAHDPTMSRPQIVLRPAPLLHNHSNQQQGSPASPRGLRPLARTRRGKRHPTTSAGSAINRCATWSIAPSSGSWLVPVRSRSRFALLRARRQPSTPKAGLGHGCCACRCRIGGREIAGRDSGDLRSLFVLMSIETLGEAWNFSWQLRQRPRRREAQEPGPIRLCEDLRIRHGLGPSVFDIRRPEVVHEAVA